jgi:hypothetical protein
MVLKDKKRNITPRALRRIIPSIMFTKDDELNSMSKKDFLDAYSMIINTSPKVNFNFINFINFIDIVSSLC